MYAIKAIYDGVNFKPTQPVPVDGGYEVIITFVEPLKKGAVRPPFGFGSMEGKIWEAEDHDWFEPMEDFKEYME